ncbi:MAG: ATP-binding protein [Anaerolineae bacterium]
MNDFPIKVLMVDDDEDDYVITRDLLCESAGGDFDLEWVSTYEAGLEAMCRGEHDVCLLDYRLGARDGLQLLRQAMAQGCRAPIILLTGQGDRKVDLEAMTAGAADYLVKGQIGTPLLERSIRYAIERKRAEEALRRLNATLEAQVAARTAEIRAEKEKSETILRNVGDAILMADQDMRVQYINPAYTALTGYSVNELLGQPASSIGAGAQSVQVEQAIEVALTRGELWQDEVLARRKDGRTYDARLTIAPVHDAEGQLVGCVASHQDISKFKELDRARNQFMTNVSHQLRTPVTSLKLSAHILSEGKQPQKTGHLLQIIKSQADRLSDLIQDILEMTALDSGQAVTSWEPLALPTVVANTVTRYQGLAEASALTLATTTVADGLPTVMGDPMRLTQALEEIVENAITFTPSGGQVAVEAGTTESQGQLWVIISVRDTGPGIRPEEQERIFDRFYRGSLAESGHIPGTGLGLSIAQEIAHAHGGRVTVQSEPGKGSIFTLWLLPNDRSEEPSPLDLQKQGR